MKRFGNAFTGKFAEMHSWNRNSFGNAFMKQKNLRKCIYETGKSAEMHLWNRKSFGNAFIKQENQRNLKLVGAITSIIK